MPKFYFVIPHDAIVDGFDIEPDDLEIAVTFGDGFFWVNDNCIQTAEFNDNFIRLKEIPFPTEEFKAASENHNRLK